MGPVVRALERVPVMSGAGACLPNLPESAIVAKGAARFGRRTARPHARSAAPILLPHENRWHEAVMDRGEGPLASSDSDDEYGLELEAALRQFAAPSLAGAIELLISGLRRARVIGNVPGRFVMPRDPVARAYANRVFQKLREATRARNDAFVAALLRGELEAFYSEDVIAGEWQRLRPGAWNYLSLVTTLDGQKTAVSAPSRSRNYLYVRVRSTGQRSQTATKAPDAVSSGTARTKKKHPGGHPGGDYDEGAFATEYRRVLEKGADRPGDSILQHMNKWARAKLRSRRSAERYPSSGWVRDQIKKLSAQKHKNSQT